MTGPIWSWPKIENSFGSVVIEILSFRQKTLLLYTLGLQTIGTDIPIYNDEIVNIFSWNITKSICLKSHNSIGRIGPSAVHNKMFRYGIHY